MFSIKPKTRKEIYMAYLAGDMSLELPEPLTRDEVTLYNLCQSHAYGSTTTVKEVLAECQPVFNNTLQGGLIGHGQEMVLTVGETYIVTMDGTEYTTLPAVDMTTMDDERMWVGLVNEGANLDTGEGLVFMVVSFVPEFAAGVHCPGVVRTTDGSVPATISIRQEVTTVQKMSGKYVEGMGWSEVTKSHSDTLTWDGVGSADDPSGEVYGNLITYHRVSDDVPSVEQLSAGGIYTLCQNSEFMDTEFTSSDVQDNTSVGFIVVGSVIIACTDNVTAQGLTFPKAGIYFVSMPNEYASGFKVNGYQFETVSETIHPIDPKFLPSGGGGALMVNITADESGNLTADKTYADIYGAVKSMPVKCVFDMGEEEGVLVLDLFSTGESTGAIFTSFFKQGEKFAPSLFTIRIATDNSISFEMDNVSSAT